MYDEPNKAGPVSNSRANATTLTIPTAKSIKKVKMFLKPI
jgi:hypothetical protein